MSNKVYVSSTCSDLKDFRKAVNSILQDLCHDVITVEEDLETDYRPAEKCLNKVKECDFYIGIFAWCYGHIPEGYDKAITELEYRQAGLANKQRFIFMTDEIMPWDKSHKDTGPNAELIQNLRSELEKNERVEYFDSPRDLSVKVADAMASEANNQLEAALNTLRMLQENEDEGRLVLRIDSRRVINVLPLEVGFFGGRRQEIDDFKRYIIEKDNRLISIVGRGGIGKTALACYIMDGLEKNAKLPVLDGSEEQRIDGIIYLSAVSTGISLERIFTDVRQMLGEPHNSTLQAKWLSNIPLEAKINYLLEALKEGMFFILLDNIETALDETGDVAEEGLRLFIEQCLLQRDNVKLIATSREKLIVSADASSYHQSIPLKKGLDEDSVLEVLRELDPQGEIGLKDVSESDLREVSKLTGGIPRALEILAGILYVAPDLTLSKMLTDKGAFGDEVMSYFVAAGYEHLEEEAQKVVEALAVYRAPIVETALKFLLSKWFPSLDVTGILTRLENNFFVHINKVTGEYNLHPLDMEYAYDKISQSEITTPIPYNQQSLNLQAAGFYKSIRKKKNNWESIVDLSPILAEFKHYTAAGDYENAFHVYELLYGHLTNWLEYPRIIEMGETILSEKKSVKKLSEALVMKVKARMSFACLASAQIDKGESAALEAKKTADTLLEKGPSNDDDYISACETISMISNCIIYHCVITGRMGKIYKITKENERKLKNVDNPLYHASGQVWYGWVLQQMNDIKAPETLERSLRLFEELDEDELDLYHLNEKERNLYILSGAYADKGQIKTSLEFYEKSRKLNEKIKDSLFSVLYPSYVGPALRYSYRFGEALNIAEEGVAQAEKHENLYHLEKNTTLTGNLKRDKGVWNIFVNKSEPEEGEEKPYQCQKEAFTFFQAAIDDYQRGVKIANAFGITVDESMLHGKIGNIYCHLGHGDPALFPLAEENLKKSLEMADYSNTAIYGAYLDLGRLCVFEACKIYCDSNGRRKEDAINKVNQANDYFSRVYEDAGKKDDNGNVVWNEPIYAAKAAYGLGVVALETALVEELKGDDRKKKLDKALVKFHEADDLFKGCAVEIEKNRFLNGREAVNFKEKYGEEPIDLRSLAEMKYGRAVALVGVLACVDEYDSDEEAEKYYTDEVKQMYEKVFNHVPDSIYFLRDIYRDLNMLRLSLDKEENKAQQAMDNNRKAVISTWLEENEGIKGKHNETARLKWGYPISKKVIEKYHADKK